MHKKTCFVTATALCNPLSHNTLARAVDQTLRIFNSLAHRNSRYGPIWGIKNPVQRWYNFLLRASKNNFPFSPPYINRPNSRKRCAVSALGEVAACNCNCPKKSVPSEIPCFHKLQKEESTRRKDPSWCVILHGKRGRKADKNLPQGGCTQKETLCVCNWIWTHG